MSPTLREARAEYFQRNGFPPDGGYQESWVKLKLGPVPIAFPNTSARKRAVPYHDLHHVVTGYDTDLLGEAEIGAWEIASSCRGFGAALYLDLQVMGFVVLAKPREVFRAFLRGRKTENLYGAPFDDALLAKPVSDVQRELGLDREIPAATASDYAAFAGWSVLSVGMNFWPVVLLLGWLVGKATA